LKDNPKLNLKYVLTLFLTFFFGFQNAKAQDSIVDTNVDNNRQLWFDYNFYGAIKEGTSMQTQVGYRNISPNVFNRFHVIPSLIFENNEGFKFLNLKKPLIDTYHVSAGLIYTQNYGTDDNLELRLSQGFKFQIPTIKQLTLQNYFRLEERFQNRFDGSGITAGYRLRYRLSTNLELENHIIKITNGFYVPLGAEIFVNIKKSDRFNDVLRLYPGIGYHTKSNWRFELLFIYNRGKNLTETNNNSNDFILRLRIFDGISRDFLKKPMNPEPIDDEIQPN